MAPEWFEAADVLASSLDCDATLSTVARLAVPDVADWVAIELESPGGLRLAALAHSDPEKVAPASVIGFPPCLEV